MEEIKELYDFICESDIVSELHNLKSDDWGLITFETSSNYSLSIYLTVRIEKHDNKFIVDKKLYNNGECTPLPQKSYWVDNMARLVQDLTDTLSKIDEMSKIMIKNFKSFDDYDILQTPSNWKQDFINKLTKEFGSTKITRWACSIMLGIFFEEETNLIKVVLRSGTFFPEEKILLHEFVSETNYKGVLNTIKTIYTDFKNKFYDIIDVITALKNI